MASKSKVQFGAVARRCAVAAAAALAAQSALAADTITMTWAGWGGANFGSGGVGYGSGSIWPNPGSALDATNPAMTPVGVGGDTFTSADTSYAFSAAGSFNTWCVDINHWLASGPVNYTVGTAADLAGAFNGSRVASLQLLANEQYAGLKTQTDSAAFQLATWAIMFGSQAGGSYQLGANPLGSTTFYASANSTGYAEAQTWLGELGQVANTGNYQISYLYQSANPVGSQNLVVLTPVPEPESYAMLLAGLGLLAGIARRRRLG